MEKIELNIYLKKIEEDIIALNEISKSEVVMYLIEISKESKTKDTPEFKSKDRVLACNSNTYISAKIDKRSKIKVYGYSDSSITSGFIQIIIASFNNSPLTELKDRFNLFEEFLKKIKIDFDTETRRNSFSSIYSKFKESFRD